MQQVGKLIENEVKVLSSGYSVFAVNDEIVYNLVDLLLETFNRNRNLESN